MKDKPQLDQAYPIIYQMIIDRYGVEAERVTPELAFKEDLGADSLDVVEMMMEIEDTFCMSIQDRAVEEIRTIQDVLDVIKAKQAE